ncbi:MAG: adenylosuccinate lyase [Legionellales bacterium]|nr:adenylosuccinate lyase [Legionellales bacterium]
MSADIYHLHALSPLDGRYADALQPCSTLFNEFSLIKWRLHIEIEWLITLSQSDSITHLPPLSDQNIQRLRRLFEQFSNTDALRIKTIEAETRHDLKAIEYYLKEQLATYPAFEPYLESIHFALTSTDVNNLAYALMLKTLKSSLLVPTLNQLSATLKQLIQSNLEQPMLARTHGQPASPTTAGKELAVFLSRLNRQIKSFEDLNIHSKFNGAVGNFNAHHIAYPNVDWIQLSSDFITQFGLTPSIYTTQIEPNDYLAEHLDNISRINTICLDLSKDIWGYISLNYFKQKIKNGQIGSSTMPHKINPIDFENAEGNLGLSNALLTHMARKLPCSRFQRDLSDSTVLRNLGVAIGYAYLAFQNLDKGLNALTLNSNALNQDLDQNWAVLAEALQTVMRRYAIKEGYEQLRHLTQGHHFEQSDYVKLIQKLDLPETVKQRLERLTPQTYTGLAFELEQHILQTFREP